MRRLVRALALGAAIGMGALGGAPARAVEPSQVADDGQQILVMLRLPPSHFRAATDYAGSYGDGLGHAERWRLAQRLARGHGLTLVGNWPMPLVEVDCYIMRVPPGRSAAEAAADFARDRAVAWAEPLATYGAQGREGAPNDPLYPVQPAARAWRLNALHAVATGRNVRVAVIDSRIDATHPDLAGQIEVSEDFTGSGSGPAERHGTEVAGIIAARANNGVGIAGVAPDARLLALRACRQTKPGVTTCDSLSLARALVYAIDRRAQVINLSLSGPPGQLLGKLLDAALSRGAVVVGAVDPTLPRGGFPASHPGVIAVSDQTWGASSSIYVAPGRDVPTTEPGGRWDFVNGSSYATAQISGLYALLREHNPRSRSLGPLVVLADGAVDACASLSKLAGHCGCDCDRTAKISFPARR